MMSKCELLSMTSVSIQKWSTMFCEIVTLYTTVLLIFSAPVQSEIERDSAASISENSLSIPALGRGARLGGLYDSRTGQFLGLNIFKQDPLTQDGLVTATEIPETNMKFYVADSLQDKIDKMGIEAQIMVDIKSGTIVVEGSARYLNEEKKSARHVEGVLYYRSRTVKQYLNVFYQDMEPYISLDALTRLNATHLVVAVEYGGDVYVQFTDRNEKSEDLMEIEGKLRVAFQSASVSVDAQASAEFKNEAQNSSSNYSVQIYGDVTGTSVPQDFEQVLSFIKLVPELLNQTNDRKGKPMVYTLLPIQALNDKYRLNYTSHELEKSIETSTYTEFVQIFDKMSETQQELNDFKELLQKNSKCVPSQDYADLEELKNSYERTCIQFKAAVKQALKQVRNGLHDSSTLDDVQVDNFNDENSPARVSEKLEQNFDRVREKIKLYTSLRKNGVTYLGRHDNLVAELLNWKGKMIQVLLYSPSKVDKNSDIWHHNLQVHHTKLSRSFAHRIVIDCDFPFAECKNITETTIHQYFEQNQLTTNARQDLDSQMAWKLDTLEIPALGRKFKIGQLFDVTTAKFLPTTIVNVGHPPAAIQKTDLGSSSTTDVEGSGGGIDYTSQSFSPFSRENFFKAIQIDPLTTLSILTDQVELGVDWRSAGLQRPMVNFYKMLTGVSTSVQRTQVKNLVLDDENFLKTIAIDKLNHQGKGPRATVNATHFVAKIVYGSTTILTLEQKIGKAPKKNAETPAVSSDGAYENEEESDENDYDYLDFNYEERERMEEQKEKFGDMLKLVENIFLNSAATTTTTTTEKTSSVSTNLASTGGSSSLKSVGGAEMFELKIFSDVNQRKVLNLGEGGKMIPDKNGMLSYLTQVTQQLKLKKGDEGQPILYILQPINSFHNFGLVIPKRGNLGVLPENLGIWTHFEQHYDDLDASREILTEFRRTCNRTENQIGLTEHDNQILFNFTESFNTQVEKWRLSVTTALSKFRVDKLTKDEVKDLSQKFRDDNLSPALLQISTKQKLGNIQEKLEILQFIRSHPFIKYMGKMGSIVEMETILQNAGKDKLIYVLVSSLQSRTLQEGKGWRKTSKYFIKKLNMPFNLHYFLDCDLNSKFKICKNLADTNSNDVIHQYYGKRLLSSNLLLDLKGQKQNKAKNGPLQIPAIVTPPAVQLGQLYDVRRRTFLPDSIAGEAGTQSWSSSSTIIDTHYEVKMDPPMAASDASPCIRADRSKKLFEQLSIPPPIGLGILSKYLLTAGPWKHSQLFNDTSPNFLHLSALCVHRQQGGVVKGLNVAKNNFTTALSLEKLFKGLNETRATHYVKKIVFGATSILYLQQAVGGNETLEPSRQMQDEATQHLTANLKFLDTFFPTVTSLKKDQEEQDDFENDAQSHQLKLLGQYQLHMFSDFLKPSGKSSQEHQYSFSSPPTNEQQVRFPKVKIDEEGVPIMYILEPLETLRTYTILLVTRPLSTYFPSSALQLRIHDLFDELEKTEQKLNNFLRIQRSPRSQQGQTEDDNQDVDNFEKTFRANVDSWRLSAKEAFQKFQMDETEANRTFNHLHSQFTQLDLRVDDLKSMLSTRFSHVTEKLRISRMMNNARIPYAGRDGREVLRTIMGHTQKKMLDDDESAKVHYYLLSSRKWRADCPKCWAINAKFFLTALKKPYNKLVFVDCDFSLSPCNDENFNISRIALYGNDGDPNLTNVYAHINDTTAGMMDEQPIEMRAVGRVAEIGDLYDASTGEFLSKSIFKKRRPTTTTGSSSAQTIIEDLMMKEHIETAPVTQSLFSQPMPTYAELFEILKLKPQDQIGVLLDRFGLERSAELFKFLKPPPKYFESTLMTWFHEKFTQRKTLDFGLGTSQQPLFDEISGSALMNSVVTQGGGATHVVQQVEYGFHHVISCRANRGGNGEDCKNSMNAKAILKMLDKMVSSKSPIQMMDHLDEVEKGGWNLLQKASHIFPQDETQIRLFRCGNYELVSNELNQQIPSGNELYDFTTDADDDDGAGSKENSVKYLKLTPCPLTYVLVPLRNLQRSYGLVARNVGTYRHITEDNPSQELKKVIELYGRIKFTEDLLQSLDATMVTWQNHIFETDLDRTHRLYESFKMEAEPFKKNFKDTITLVMSGQKWVGMDEALNGFDFIPTFISTNETNNTPLNLHLPGDNKPARMVANELKTGGGFEVVLKKIETLQKFERTGQSPRDSGEGGGVIELLHKTIKNLSDIFVDKSPQNVYLLFYKMAWTTGTSSLAQSWQLNSNFFFNILGASDRRIIVDCDFEVEGCDDPPISVDCDSEVESCDDGYQTHVRYYLDGKLNTTDAQARARHWVKQTGERIKQVEDELRKFKLSFSQSTENLEKKLNNTIDQVTNTTDNIMDEIDGTISKMVDKSTKDIQTALDNQEILNIGFRGDIDRHHIQIQRSLQDVWRSIDNNNNAIKANKGEYDLIDGKISTAMEVVHTNLTSSIYDYNLNIEALKIQVNTNKLYAQTNRTYFTSKISNFAIQFTNIYKRLQLKDSFIWKVKNVPKLINKARTSKKLDDQIEESPTFDLLNYKIQIILYINGVNKTSIRGQYVSIYYQQMKGDYDDILPLLNTLPVKLILYRPLGDGTQVNHQYPPNTDTASGGACETITRKQDVVNDRVDRPCGTKTFITTTEFDQKFLKDNAVFIGVEVALPKPRESSSDVKPQGQ